MDRRFLLALVLTALVVIGVPLLFPSNPAPAPGVVAADSLAGGADRAAPPQTAAPAAPVTAPPVAAARPDSLAASDSAAAPAPAGTGIVATRAETTTVATPVATYRFSSIGAAPVSAEMRRHTSLRDGERGEPVELARAGEPLLRYRVVVPGDTISFHDVPFQVSRGAAAAGDTTGTAPIVYRGTADGVQVTIQYSFRPDSYLVDVRGSVQGVPGRSFLLVDFPSGLRSAEANLVDDLTHTAFAYKPVSRDASSIGFGALDPGERELTEGALSWVALKSKYFVVGLLAPDSTNAFAQLQVTGGAQTEKQASNAIGELVVPLGTDGFGFRMYAGPQEWRRLRAIGGDFENVNPYGGWFQGMIQPFATLVMRLLLWIRETTALNYGWVLVIFGVGVRLVMWPLNQTAMRAQLKMQRVQPELQAAQKKYPNDPQKQQQEMMRIYKEHGMSPFSTLSGCLPMLIPMPVLFALFFVFQNTIEFRGVPFLWLQDISLKDPYYIVPLLMGITTFLVSWIGMRGAPPNPQAKVLTYVMPLALIFILANMASGLNLYYTVQNLAAIPQQWLIARERSKVAAAAPKPVVEGKPTPPPSGPSGSSTRQGPASRKRA